MNERDKAMWRFWGRRIVGKGRFVLHHTCNGKLLIELFETAEARQKWIVKRRLLPAREPYDTKAYWCVLCKGNPPEHSVCDLPEETPVAQWPPKNIEHAVLPDHKFEKR